MKINSDRLLENLRALRRFTDTPGEGVTRFSYGEQDKKAREYISERAKAAGCTVRVDDVGNIRIGLPGNVPGRQSVLCGSHIDTVRNGGWLDGAYGVCGALEVLECLAEGVKTGADQPLNYEMVIFAEEEGTNFGSTMTGGKFLTGKYGDADLDKLTDDQGRTLREVLAEHKPPEAAGKPVLTVPWDLSSIAAMLELHIEQGPMLERAGRSIGIVDAVFGIGLKSVLRDDKASLLNAADNAGFKHVIAVDMPSGINSDSGELMGAGIHASATITFGRMKTGLAKGEGPGYAGEVLVKDIGIPEEAYIKTSGA